MDFYDRFWWIPIVLSILALIASFCEPLLRDHIMAWIEQLFT